MNIFMRGQETGVVVASVSTCTVYSRMGGSGKDYMVRVKDEKGVMPS